MSINQMLDNYEEPEEVQDDSQEAEDGGESSGNQGKQISQAQINKIVEERLARERKKYADYDDLRDIAENLKKYGYSGTVKEIREQLKQAVDVAARERELEALQEEAERLGTTPELLLKMKELEKKGEAPKKEQEPEATPNVDAQAEWKAMKDEFQERYPEVDLKALAEDKGFMKYANKLHNGVSLVDAYETYVDMMEEAKAQAFQKVVSKANRATNSGKGKNSAEGGTYGLTPTQQEIARKAGMSYKDYAARMKEIQ